MGRVTIPLSLSLSLTTMRRLLLVMSPCIMVTAGAFLVVASRPHRNPASCFSHATATTQQVFASNQVSSSLGLDCALLHSQARHRQPQDKNNYVCRRKISEDRFTCLFRTRLFNGASPNNNNSNHPADEEDEDEEELLLLELDNLDGLYVDYTEEDDDDSDNNIENNDNEEDDDQNELFLRQELGKLNDLEAMLLEMEEDLGISLSGEGEEGETLLSENNMSVMEERQKAEDAELLEQLLGGLLTEDTIWEEENIKGEKENTKEKKATTTIKTTPSPLERALLQGVVPADAGVGSGCLPGDYGFDPLNVATKDYFRQVQTFLLNILNWGGSHDDEEENYEKDKKNLVDVGAAMPKRGFVGNDQGARPPALILRDYREAEIRHGRLAMLAALFWPLQEIFDRMFLPERFGSTTVIYGGTTLPYLTLLMTLFMMLLGYLDIYAKTVKDNDTGEAFLPGECFWDPLNMLEGAPDTMKRNMQERELINGRVAMVAVGAFIFEEAASHRPIVSIPGNQLLFTPAYEIPAIQAWLDNQFQPQYNGEEDFVGVIQDIINQQDIPIEDITSSFLP